MILTIITFFVVLSVLVLIHEAGHFFAAKLIGVKVLEFGLGLPPKLFGVKHGETVYSINALPIGGFVRLFGEDESTTKDKSEIDRAFYRKPPLQKLFVTIAGVVMNFTLAVVIISYIFSQGVFVPSDKVFVENVSKNSPAAKVGIKKDDQILKIGKYEIKSTDSLIKYTKIYEDQETEIFVSRKVNGGVQNLKFKVVPRKNPPAGEGALGISISNLEFKKYSIFEAPIMGISETVKMTVLTLQGLIDVFARLFRFAEVPKEVAGPVGIARLIGQATQYGFMAVLQLMGMLSLNLAVINIIPFPALDGGRIFFILIELVTRRRVNPRFEAIVNTIGLAILIGLIFLVTRNDILRK